MVAIAPLKKSTCTKEWMAQADPPKEANKWKKEKPGCYSSLQIKRYFTLKAHTQV